MDSSIQVASGGLFDPLHPDPDKIDVENIAFSLGNTCRFGGHVRYYSVAEHSVHVSRACDPGDALWGLLHDAPEGLGLGDMATPLKSSRGLGTAYREAELLLLDAVVARFGLGPSEPESVTAADHAMLWRERKILLPRTDEAEAYWEQWAEELGGIDDDWLPEYCTPHGFGPEVSQMIFLERFKELT